LLREAEWATEERRARRPQEFSNPHSQLHVVAAEGVESLVIMTIEVERLDPYQLMAALGKRVIHPGGSRSTEELFALARIGSDQSVLEIGCGVGTTAIEAARRFGAKVTAIDIDERMLAATRQNIAKAGLDKRIEVLQGDIEQLPFQDASFDRVVIEAVTMFTDRERSVREVVRVCRPGGRVVDHEFVWRRPPSAEARRIFVDEVCPGIAFESEKEWQSLYEQAGLRKIEVVTGPFTMMTPGGFIRDEGLNSFKVLRTGVLRSAYRRRLWWLMRKMLPAVRSLGYVVIGGTRA